ncbi:MAG: glutamine--fructose-6-phosphate transaminase (isomerizing) [Bdellovibrionales bacterium]|nr:glutamine--fructose-6-phosphate transaminase (isomerizing) [Bdellovibrionales bacterium]
MCGIVGYLGSREALPIILSGLRKLEYRGYDSAGVAVFAKSEVVLRRAQGKLDALASVVQRDAEVFNDAHLGIGHTRWATHGKPSENNAHPHCAGRVSLIHNGIIENYLEIRDKLGSTSEQILSETDTEIVAHLLNHHLEADKDPFDALRETCSEIRGSYAFVAFDSENPDRLLIAKNSTPIIIGLGKNEVFIASDIPAILDYTRDVIILEDGDLADVRVGEIRIENGGKPVKREVETITWDPVTAQKGGFKHYMLKEIFEQPIVAADTFRGRIEHETGAIQSPELQLGVAEIQGIKKVVFVACGTAWHACLMGKFYIEHFARIPCEVDYASEFRYRSPILDKDTLVVAISQSGETADTLGAIEVARGSARTLAISNVVGSSITRKVDTVFYTHAGPEISVASTKAFSTQLVAVYLLALYLAQVRQSRDSESLVLAAENLFHLPTAMSEALKCDEQVQNVAKKFCKADDFLYIARGFCYPVALEGALKLKEISYIHAEGYPAGEMKHGPIALISEKMPVVVILQRSKELFEKALSNMREVESRGGRIIAITDSDRSKEIRSITQDVIEVPFISEELSPVLLNLPLQLLAYHIAVLNGTDVDQPRNLAKSVTVE